MSKKKKDLTLLRKKEKLYRVVHLLLNQLKIVLDTNMEVLVDKDTIINFKHPHKITLIEQVSINLSLIIV